MKYVTDIKNDKIKIQIQDNYFGGGQTYIYNGEQITIEITFNDKSKFVCQTTYISAWLNCAEGGYCKIKINSEILGTKQLIKYLQKI